MLKKRIILGIVAVAALAVAYQRFQSRPRFQYIGTLETTRVDVPSRLATVIEQVNIEEGQQVKKDEKIFELDCRDIHLASDQVSKSYQRSAALTRTGVVSPESNDEMRRRKQELDLKLSWCDVVSPLDGTILDRYFEEGEWVNPGSKLATIANTKDIWAYFYVPHDVRSQLQVGQTLHGKIAELNQAYTGKIIKINAEAEFTPKNVQTLEERTRLVFGVKVQFDNKSDLLKPGMSIEVDLPKTSHHG